MSTAFEVRSDGVYINNVKIGSGGASSWAELTGKPTTLEEYSITATDVLNTVKTVDGTGTGLDADTVDGLHSTAFATAAQGTKADNALPSSSYTAADILTKIKTVDGTGTGLDADTVDGNHASAFATAAQGAKADTYTAADVLTKLKTVDGTGTGLDADLLDGLEASAFATAAQGTLATNALPASSYTAADVLTKLKTVDGTGTGLDADLLDGLHSTAFATAAQGTKADNALPASSYTAADVLAKLLTVDGAGSGLNADLLDGYSSANFEYRQTINTVRNNLGDPTVAEMALFHGQFNNKFRFIAPYLQEESTDGLTWVASTRASAATLKDMMIGDGQGTSFSAIPISAVGASGYYRLTWDTTSTGYVYLNWFYAYCSASGNTVATKIEVRNAATQVWSTLATGNISNWPGHASIPHTTVAFSTSTDGGHYDLIRVAFSITNATYANAFTLCGIEWFGGYPAGRRNVESYDRDKNVTFPGHITGTELVSTVATGTSPFTVTSTTKVTNLNADLLDGLEASAFATSTQGTKADNALPSSSYTAADVLSKLITVDGTGTNLDADLLDGNHASAFATAAQGTKADNALPSSSYTAADVLAKIKTVDGTGTGLDADTVDGVHLSGLMQTSHAANAITGLGAGSATTVSRTDHNHTSLSTQTALMNMGGYKITNMADGSANTDAITVQQLNTAIANATSGSSTSLHVPVADLAACKAVVALGRADKMIMNVESLGLYRFDAESTATSDDNSVIRPTDVASDASAGRWIKMAATINDHNNLGNMQGGTTGEYYHLTSAQKTYVANFTSDPQTQINSKQASLGYNATKAGDSYLLNSVFVMDNRSTNILPEDRAKGMYFDFMSNTTGGLSDGGTYFGLMTFRQYGSGTDWSGGTSKQLGFTDNGNMYIRNSSANTWGSWKKFWNDSNLTFSSTATDIKMNGTQSAGSLSTMAKADHIHPTDTSRAATGQTMYIGTTALAINRASAALTLTGTSIDGNAATATNVAWSGITSKPTTLATFGITDATPSSHVGATGTAHGVVTGSVNGFMIAADKTKLDGVATGANNYTHPSSHAPSIITQDASNRFVTDTEKATWSAKTPFSTLSATTPATLGWYRIATSALNIGANSALFKVDFSGTGVKGSVLFRASCHDGVGVGTNLNQLGFTSSDLTLGLTKIRIVYHTTATGNYAYLEIYNPTALAITYTVDLIDTTGWGLLTPSTAGSIPSGYISEELTLDSGFVSNEDITTAKQFRSNIATGTAPFVVTSTTKVANLSVETSAACSGNAATATKLATPRKINNVNFDGSANILAPTLYDANYYSIINPGGATYVTQTTTVTGAIAITLPVGMVGTMVRMTVKIYEYVTNKSFEVHCGGYPYSSGNTWTNSPFAYIIGNPGANRQFNIRFGYTSTGKAVIYIGELASTWSYPQVFVTDVQCGFGGQSSTWLSGWWIGFQSSAFENVTATITNPQIGLGVATATANTLVLREASGHIYGAYFNSSAALENTTATEYMYGIGDGFIRKKSLANVKTELVTSAAVIAGLGYTPLNKAGDTTSGQYSFTKVDDHGIKVGTVRGTAVGSQTGYYMHLYDRVHIGSPNGWGSNGAPANGLSTYGGAWFAVASGSVGIGTESPQFKLDVAGDSRVQASNVQRFGGTGASDSKYSIGYNSTMNSLDICYVG